MVGTTPKFAQTKPNLILKLIFGRTVLIGLVSRIHAGFIPHALKMVLGQTAIDD